MLGLRWFMVTACVGLLAASGLADENAVLKVMTYNIRFANPGDGKDVWPHRVDRVAETISGVDLAGLQEVTDPQLRDLQSRLDGFDCYGVGRDDGKQAGEYSPIFYRSDRLSIEDRGTFWLSETPTEVASIGWDASMTRICSWVLVRDKRSGIRFWFASTHFDHVGSEARRRSGELIVEWVGRHADDLPAIVVGDFNCLPGSEPYGAMVSADAVVRLFDARLRTEPQGPRSTWNGFAKIEPGRLIDHIFVTDSVEMESLEVLNPKTAAGRFASDHLPVVATVRLPSP